MDVEIIYPSINPKIKKRFLIRNVTLALFSITFAICTIVNIFSGGRAWCLLVLGAEILFWNTFIHIPAIENTFISKISVTVMSVCGYLLLVDLIYGDGWSAKSIPILVFSLLTFNGLIFFFGFKHQKRNFMPLLVLVISSIIFLITSLAGALKTTWQIIVLGSTAFSIIILSFIFFKNELKLELKKKFHS